MASMEVVPFSLASASFVVLLRIMPPYPEIEARATGAAPALREPPATTGGGARFLVPFARDRSASFRREGDGPRSGGPVRPHNRRLGRHRPRDGPRLRRRRVLPAPRGEVGREPPCGPGGHLARLRRISNRPPRRPERAGERAAAGGDLRRRGRTGQQRRRRTGGGIGEIDDGQWREAWDLK